MRKQIARVSGRMRQRRIAPLAQGVSATPIARAQKKTARYDPAVYLLRHPHRAYLELDADAQLAVEVAFESAFSADGHSVKDSEFEAQCDDERSQNRRDALDGMA